MTDDSAPLGERLAVAMLAPVGVGIDDILPWKGDLLDGDREVWVRRMRESGMRVSAGVPDEARLRLYVRFEAFADLKPETSA